MLDIKQEVLENIIQTLNAVTGETVQEGMDCLARLVKENEGNEITEKFNENCKKMQSYYNEFFVTATGTLLDEYSTMDEMRGAISRAASNMTETKTGSTAINADKLELPEL